MDSVLTPLPLPLEIPVLVNLNCDEQLGDDEYEKNTTPITSKKRKVVDAPPPPTYTQLFWINRGRFEGSRAIFIPSSTITSDERSMLKLIHGYYYCTMYDETTTDTHKAWIKIKKRVDGKWAKHLHMPDCGETKINCNISEMFWTGWDNTNENRTITNHHDSITAPPLNPTKES